MPNTDVWPPKPDLPDPLTEYDALIEAALPTLASKTVDYDLVLPLWMRQLPGLHWMMGIAGSLVQTNDQHNNRAILLMQVLQEDKGLDLRQAQAFVLSYYQRHGLGPTRKSAIILFSTIGLLLLAGFSSLATLYFSLRRNAILSQPNHGVALLELDHAKWLLQIFSTVLLGIIYGFWILRYWVIRLRNRKK